MKHEEIVNKLRGVKVMLNYISENTGNMKDDEFAFSLLANVIEDCIQELE